MRTRFVINKNLLSPVYRVIKRPYCIDAWYPEDIPVENPKRKHERGYFILPKSEYVACDKNGVVKEDNVETAYLTHCGSQHES